MRFGIRELAFIAFMLGLVAGTYAMVVRPHARAREEKLAQIASMDIALETLLHSTADLDDLEKRVERESKAVAFLQTKLPHPSETDKIIHEITEMASANSLQTISGTSLTAYDISGYLAQPVEIVLSGDFNGVYTFVQQLENLPHTARVARISLKSSPARDGDIQASIDVVLYQTADRVQLARTVTGTTASAN